MRRTTLVALVIVTLLSGCSTYQTPHGRRLADPKFCTGDGAAICVLGAGAAVIGVGLALSN
jgi:Prokaryotic membrane lipoprotein lipid attachment site